jgi:hypothetical protein
VSLPFDVPLALIFGLVQLALLILGSSIEASSFTCRAAVSLLWMTSTIRNVTIAGHGPGAQYSDCHDDPGISEDLGKRAAVTAGTEIRSMGSTRDSICPVVAAE